MVLNPIVLGAERSRILVGFYRHVLIAMLEVQEPPYLLLTPKFGV